MAPSRAALFSLLLVAAATVQGGHARRLAGTAPQQQAAAVVTSTCIVGSNSRDVCNVHPAYSFSSDLASKLQSPADRLYQAVMAQRILCREKVSQAACTGEQATDGLYCTWNAGAHRCQAEKHTALLLPLTCPGSRAHTFMRCQRQTSSAACRADPVCGTADDGWTCFPRWLLDEAAAKPNATAQSVAEQTALLLLKGDAELLGSCDGTAVLEQLFRTCPYDNNWSGCNVQYCNFDVPPFVPKRPEADRRTSMNYESPPPPGGRMGLSYFGAYAAPVCMLDSERMPAVLHSILGVSASLADAIAAADAACKAADTVAYDPARKLSYCGSSAFTYDPAAVLHAAAATGGSS